MNGELEKSVRANILLVDDTPNNLRLLSAMLIEQGYEVRRVINGQMALKTAQANPPDLILLDIKMPDMNGYEVCQHLKAIAQTASIPVIFISALDEVLDKVKAFAVGGVDYITKPFSEEEVFARVENILTIRKLQQQLQQQHLQLQQIATERQRLEAQLTNVTANHHNLFNNPFTAVFRMRLSDGLVLQVNQRFCEVFGYASMEAIAQKRYWIEHWVSPAQWQEILAEWQAGDSFSRLLPSPVYTVQFHHPDQSTFEAHLSIWLTSENDLEGVLASHSI